MENPILIVLQCLGALVAGGVIGFGFGKLQELAANRYRELEHGGQFHSGWAVMPRSFGRVSFLLVALVMVQLVCPLLFKNGGQWWVSAGVLGGYAVVLSGQLIERGRRGAASRPFERSKADEKN